MKKSLVALLGIGAVASLLAGEPDDYIRLEDIPELGTAISKDRPEPEGFFECNSNGERYWTVDAVCGPSKQHFLLMLDKERRVSAIFVEGSSYSTPEGVRIGDSLKAIQKRFPGAVLKTDRERWQLQLPSGWCVELWPFCDHVDSVDRSTPAEPCVGEISKALPTYCKSPCTHA